MSNMFEKMCFGVEASALSVIATKLDWHGPGSSGSDIMNVLVLFLFFAIIVREAIAYVKD